MADNGSWCKMTENEVMITNIVYSGLSFLSLIIGLVSMLLHKCFYKDKHQSDLIDGILFFVLLGCCFFELCESFQWFLLLKDFYTGCVVLGAVREYIIIGLLVIITCIGTHLLILIVQPKCLQVIEEVKLQRYRIILRVYIIAAFLVPFFFLPWPFISGMQSSLRRR